eukprot:s2316_g3.t1
MRLNELSEYLEGGSLLPSCDPDQWSSRTLKGMQRSTATGLDRLRFRPKIRGPAVTGVKAQDKHLQSDALSMVLKMVMNKGSTASVVAEVRPGYLDAVQSPSGNKGAIVLEEMQFE